MSASTLKIKNVSNPVDAITITYTDNDTIASIKEKIRDVKNLSSSTVIRLENVNKTELSDAAQVLRHASRGDTVYWNTEQDSRPSNRTGPSSYSIRGNKASDRAIMRNSVNTNGMEPGSTAEIAYNEARGAEQTNHLGEEYKSGKSYS